MWHLFGETAQAGLVFTGCSLIMRWPGNGSVKSIIHIIQMGVSIVMGLPPASLDGFVQENHPLKYVDDLTLGVPPFSETSKTSIKKNAVGSGQFGIHNGQLFVGQHHHV